MHVIESITLSSSHVSLPSLHLTQSVLLVCVTTWHFVKAFAVDSSMRISYTLAVGYLQVI